MSQPLNLTKEDYWSTLTQSFPCDVDIKRTQQLIDKYNITTPQQITMLYFKMDLLQLIDELGNFVEKSTLIYGINSLYSYTAPDYTWIAGMKFTKTKLHYINDNHLVMLLENKTRSGVSSVMGDRHFISDVNKQILYIKANNQIGWALCQNFPTGEFEKLSFPNSCQNFFYKFLTVTNLESFKIVI